MGDGGGGHCLVLMEWCPSRWSVCLPLLIFPCTIKSRSSLLASAHPGGPGKRAVKRLWCGDVDDFQPSSVDASYSQSVLPKPRPIKASASSLDLALPESNLAKVPSMTSDDSTLSSSAAFRPFRSQPPASACEAASRLMSQVVLPSQSASQPLYCPSTLKLENVAVSRPLPATFSNFKVDGQ